MYQYLTATPEAQDAHWALKFIVWWCGLFGINDPQTIQMVVAVIVAGIFLFAIYIAAACVVGMLMSFRQRPGA